MHRLKSYKNKLVTGSGFSWQHRCVAHLCRIPLMNFFINNKNSGIQNSAKSVGFIVLLISFCINVTAQRQDFSLNNNWLTSLGETNDWKPVNVPHNWDDYYGYRRLLHGNLHGAATYKRTIAIKQTKTGKRFFLFFEGVGSYATVFLNGKQIGEHAGGRTSFTIDVTEKLKTDGTPNALLVEASHPANIEDLPWVCGGCSDERGFSEGSQPMGIFRPVHLIVTSDLRIQPFGIHAWASINNNNATLFINSTIKNYTTQDRKINIVHQLYDAGNNLVATSSNQQTLHPNDSLIIKAKDIVVNKPKLWDVQNPYLYKIVSTIVENKIVIDKTTTEFGFRTLAWNSPTHQFTLNNKPVFINGIAEYEHLIGQSHAFSNEQIIARIKWIQSAGFNALRDAHQPHNLLYGKLCNEKGLLWWTQLSAHIWYDTKAFRDNFKTLLKEWVIERRNDPSVILWGLQNESKLPKDFAEECTALIRSLDPTASTQRLVTTCNGGEGTDWDVPQNWTGTYGGNPATYGADLKKQILVGEYGAWRTIDLHTEGGFVQNGPLSEDRMTQLMEQKVRLAESVKDSVAGHFFWLLTSHDNPGRVQGGEGLREMDRIGPVNYKGMLTPWEEPTDAYYMFRSNYAPKEKEPMVYIVSHTWPNRWMQPGIKDSINVYSNCDEVELFNDINGSSLGRKKKQGIGTHFQWNKVNIQYNVLYAVGYVNGKAMARDTIVLFHLPQSPNYDQLYAKSTNITKPLAGYNYLYRINCGGPLYTDENNNQWTTGKYVASSWTGDFENLPKEFASQRRTFSPIKNTHDWKLFQSFRYGKDKLKFDFDVADGEYLVDLYFIEPWLGIGGGIDATGMRIFDVAINDETVLNDLDIWKEAGSNTVLRKTVSAKSVNGKIVISFPETKVGQALISAITIAKKMEAVTGKTKVNITPTYNLIDWLDIGDKQFGEGAIQINTLPSNLFGADWVQLDSKESKNLFEYNFESSTDLFIAVKTGTIDSAMIAGFENTNTQIVTDENGGTIYHIYKKRYAKADSISLNINANLILCKLPVTGMQPAYDLKPSVAYRPDAAKLLGDGLLKSTINDKETISFTNNQSAIEWNINIGAADIYSLTIRYSNETNKTLGGKLEMLMADGTVIQIENITFTESKTGKWSYISINTRSMVNAGDYILRIVAVDAIGVGISGLDLQ
ncbi:MAG: malectin domain-containing carbohydrate-binding protein [Ferruginibacter sp.]